MAITWPHAEYRAHGEPRQGKVKVSKLNVRGGPGVSYPVVDSLSLGEAVEVRGQMEYEGYLWGNIASGDAFDRWAALDYITWETDGELPVAIPDPKWERSWPIVLRIEGELSLDPNDKGNWYKGRLIGTKYGISARQWAGQYDIPSLTKSQALNIYRQHYWLPAGCEHHDFPMCMILFDTAVQHGVGTATALLNGQPSPELQYLGQRALLYMDDPDWKFFGEGWKNRVDYLQDIVQGEVPA